MKQMNVVLLQGKLENLGCAREFGGGGSIIAAEGLGQQFGADLLLLVNRKTVQKQKQVKRRSLEKVKSKQVLAPKTASSPRFNVVSRWDEIKSWKSLKQREGEKDIRMK